MPLKFRFQVHRALLSLGLSFAVYGGLSQSEAGYRAVLAFLPPHGGEMRRSQPETRDQDLRNWSTPAESARFSLESKSFPEQLATVLKTGSGPKGLEFDPFLLTGQGRLRCRLLTPCLLEIAVFEENRELALAYTLGTLRWLEKDLKRQRTFAELNPSLEGDAYKAKEQTVQLEQKLARVIGNPEQLPMLQFSLEHYREAFTQYRSANALRDRWTENIVSNHPEFTVISGPSPFHRAKYLSKAAATGIALALLLVLTLIQAGPGQR